MRAFLTAIVAIGVAAVFAFVTVLSPVSADEGTTGKIQIVRVEYNVKGTDTSANAYMESVKVRNNGVSEVSPACNILGVGIVGKDMTGWSLEDLTGHRYRFPNGYCLPNGAEVNVRTGKSPSSDSGSWWNNRRVNLYWGRTSHQFGNAADSVVLENNDGSRQDRVTWNDFTILP